MARRATISHLEEHPNLDEILGILSQLVHISDDEIVRLASAWRNTVAVAEARRRALSPDSPLVIEVLAAFDGVSALYADDLAGGHDFIRVEPAVTTLALKAVRDAIAAAYARPVLTRTEHLQLMAAWRSVFAQPALTEPDLGPAASEVKKVLALVPTLGRRCHDETGRRLYDGLLVNAMTLDEEAHQAAVEQAYQAAIATGRRRVWALVRRSTEEGLGRLCPECRAPRDAEEGPYDRERVLALLSDATCALLVVDAVDQALADQLTAPLQALIPLQRASD